MSDKRRQRKHEQARRAKALADRRDRRATAVSPEQAKALDQSESAARLAGDSIRAILNRRQPDRYAALAGSAATATVAVEVADAARGIALTIIQQSPLAGRHECRAGCAFCCHTAVAINVPEALAMLAHLRTHSTPAELANIQRDLGVNAALAGLRGRTQYVAENIPCALLTKDGNCRVHPVRPLACAGFMSTSRTACEREFHRVFNRGLVPVDPFALQAGLGVSHGVKDACDAAGLDGRYYELHHALRHLWDMPDAAACWSAGEYIMDGCLRAADW